MSADDPSGEAIYNEPTQPVFPAPASNRETGDWDATDPAHPVRKSRSAQRRDDIIARTKLTLPPLSMPGQVHPLVPSLRKPVSSTRPLSEGAAGQAPGAAGTGQHLQQPGPQGVPDGTSSVPPSLTPPMRFKFPSAPASGPLPSKEQRPVSHTLASGAQREPKKSVRKPLIFALVALVAVLLLTILFVVAGVLAASPGHGPVVASVPHSSTPKIISRGVTDHPIAPTGNGPGIRHFQVGAHPLLMMKGHRGDVSVLAGGNGIVQIDARKHGSGVAGSADTQVQYVQSQDEQGQDRLDVTTVPGDTTIDFAVTVPAATQVQIQMDGGAITVNGISGVTIDTFNSNLDVENISGPVDVQTENGNITARSLNGMVKMQTQNGSIRVNAINGQVQAQTQNGDVVLRKAALRGQSVLETDNGSVRVSGALDPGGTYKLKTTRGDINLSLPANAAFQLSAHTASGSVSNDFGGGIVGVAPRPSVSLTINGGGSISVNQAL